jgi:plasmid maintenance system antidote protein VapI
MSVNPFEFHPDWTVCTGAILTSFTAETPLSELATTLGVAPDWLSGFIRGEQALTAEVAKAIGRLTDTDASLWLRIESNYRQDLAEGRKVTQ